MWCTLVNLKFVSKVADSIGQIFQFDLYYAENIISGEGVEQILSSRRLRIPGRIVLQVVNDGFASDSYR